MVLSLDGTYAVEQNAEEGEPTTALSILDHYKMRPSTCFLDSITLLQFAKLNDYLGFQNVEERILWSLFPQTIHQTLMELTTSSTVVKG